MARPTSLPAIPLRDAHHDRRGDGGRQNTSDAVMAQRGRDSKDDFPTPPWATRALLRHVIRIEPGMSCLEPAAGRGYMAEVLREDFATVTGSDAWDYGYCPVRDFAADPYGQRSFDWMITNPPFKLAEQFAHVGLQVARRGVALLTRLSFLETQRRRSRLFKLFPPSLIAVFVERVAMVEGRYDPEASTATAYCWVIWDALGLDAATCFTWIDPCRTALERADDALDPSLRL